MDFLCAHTNIQTCNLDLEILNQREKERGWGYFWSGSVFMARPSSAAVTDLELKLH